MTSPRRLLTVAEVAAILRVRPWSVLYQIKAGHLAHTRIGNKNIRIAPEDLDKYLEDNTVVGETT